MKYYKTRSFIFIVLVVMVFIHCAPNKNAETISKDSAKKQETSRMNKKQLDEKFELILGKGGGFAGLWSGYRLIEDGTVYQWAGKKNQTEGEKVGVLPFDTLACFYQRIESDSLFADSLADPGNLTKIMKFKKDTSEFYQLWHMGSEGSENLEIFYNELEGVINRLIIQGEKDEN